MSKTQRTALLSSVAQNGKVSRRGFLKGSALAGLTLGVTGAGLTACSPKEQAENKPAETGDGNAPKAVGYQYEAETAEGEWHHSACPRNCYDTCMMLSKVVDGRLVAVKGDPDSPFTAGGLCPKTQNYVDYVYSEERILYPMKRTGKKGPGCTFERISWDEAIKTITDTWKKIIEEDGPESITWFRYQGTNGATQQTCMEPLFYKMGATYHEAALCVAAMAGARPYASGWIPAMDAAEVANKDLYISWAFNPSACSVHSMKYVKEMHKAGGKIVVVNPMRIPECEWADMHVRLLPGTDTAFVMGVSKYLIDNGKIDEKFIKEWSIGFDDYKAACAEWTAEKVAAECGIPAEQVAEFAELVWENRENFVLRPGLQICRRNNGGMATMAVILLTGLVGHPEAYFAMSSDGGFSSPLVRCKDMFTETVPSEASNESTIRNYSSPSLGKVLNGENFGEGHDFSKKPIRSLMVFCGNPMVSNPNQNLLRKGLEREDLFTIVHDIFLTPTVEYADIVLPAPSWAEIEEYDGGYGHSFSVFNEKVIEPLGECKDNLEVCNLLGQAMGYDDDAFHRDMETLRESYLEGSEYSYEELVEKGWFWNEPTPLADAIAEEGYPTPSGKFQFASDELLADHGTRTLAYVPDVEGPGDPERFAKYPIALVTPSAKEFLNGVFGNLEDNIIVFGENYVYLNEDDAATRDIADGDEVIITNDRGELHRIARVEPGVMAPGTACTYKSTWPVKSGVENANCVTTDNLSDFGRGSSYMSCVVEIAKA